MPEEKEESTTEEAKVEEEKEGNGEKCNDGRN